MAFVLKSEFWADETQAPMLGRNHGFLTQDTAASIVVRAQKWPSLCGIDTEIPRPSEELKDIKPFKRIFAADAERTFKTPFFRQHMIELLERVGAQFGDYHQGMGYIASFLSLTLDQETVFNILLRLNQEQYQLGYFRGTPETFVRDAHVFHRLIAEQYPETAAHLELLTVAPEAYASKWFVGLNLHVLPFEPLFDFYELFLERGWPYLFQFALSLLKVLSPRILEAGRDVAKVFALLRLDPSLFPDTSTLFAEVIELSKTIDLDVKHVSDLKAEEWDKLQAKLERIRQREKEMAEEDDDEEEMLSDSDEDDQ
eukprot:c889_g1_i1.p1 GENE.c889_g1_i1~~c889_g1_i1.p1  ORF type:complete len:313 (-),score=55.39 c889_g1_i1:55-993(-)